MNVNMELENENFEPTSFERNCINGNTKGSNAFRTKEIVSVDRDDKDTSEKSDIPVLLKLVEDVYNQRLLAIENNDNLTEKEKTEEKLVALKSYVRQLQDQNDTFAATMIELEKEAQQRVKQMEKRLKSSAKTTMEAVLSMNECEREMRRLVEERLYIESLYRDTRQHLSSVKLENNYLRDQNFNLNHDVQALLHVIHHARSTGHWEMDCVTFCEVTPEQVFGPVQSISQIYSAESESHLYDQERKKEKTVSTVLPSNVGIPKCVSLPEIGNIYSNLLPVRKSNSYETNTDNLILNINCLKEISNKTRKNEGTTELLKDMSHNGKNEQMPCIRKGQSEPHLFMFNDNVYKYRPCESIHKTSETALNENYQSSLPPYQSIDLKFPTDESALKVCAWNKLKNKSYADAQENSVFKDTTSNSSFSISESEIRGMNKQMLKLFGEEITSCLQEKKTLFSIGLQTETDKITQATQVEMNEGDFLDMNSVQNNIVQVLKENLIKAENKAEEKGILIEQLQSHLTTAVKEVELKDKALVNLEKKLETSRNTCFSLKSQIDDLNSEIKLLLKDLEETRMLNSNFKLQMEQQSQIIRTLQEALVQSKRAFDAAHPKLPLIQPVTTETQQNRNQPSKGSIVDI